MKANRIPDMVPLLLSVIVAALTLLVNNVSGQWLVNPQQPRLHEAASRPFAAFSTPQDDPPASAASGGLFFNEIFSYDLGGFFCENNLAVADFNGDGSNDIALVVTRFRWDARAILLCNQGDGTFKPSIIADYPGGYGYATAAADLNNDGTPDLLVRESQTTHVLINDGTGNFNEASTFHPGYASQAMLDLDGDALPEVISGTQTGNGGLIELFQNVSGATFVKAWESRLYGTGFDTIATVLFADLNNDDVPDLLAREIYGGLLVSLFGMPGSFSFEEKTVRQLGDRTFALTIGNLDGDQTSDAAVHVGWGQVRVLRNDGAGVLSDFWQSPQLGEAAFNLALQDFDGDGLDDIFVGTFGDGALRIYRNLSGIGFELAWTSSVPGDGSTGTASDVDGDGDIDLIVGEPNRIRILLNTTQNHPPIADASATAVTAIAGGNERAVVVLDGSRSFDPDGQSLRYVWLENGTPIGHGVLSTNLLTVGTHGITLQVDDGRETNMHSLTVDVITPCTAIQNLIATINKELSGVPKYRRALLAQLRVACHFADKGRRATALHQLQVFERKVRGVLSSTSPTLAEELGRAAQQVQNALFSIVQFSSRTYLTFEGNQALAVHVLRLGDLSETLAVDYQTSDGTATAGLDYVPLRGTLEFAPLEASQTIYLSILRDELAESNETVRILLKHPTGGASLGDPAVAEVTIRDRGPSIVWSLHDEDPDYSNPPFNDTLQALDEDGNVLANITGINICQTIGAWRAVAAVDQGQAVLLCEFCLNGPMSKYDLQGNRIFSLERNIYAADVGISGTIYALTSSGSIFGENILKISSDGEVLAEAAVGGVDLVVDEEHQRIFVVGADLKGVDLDLRPLWTTPIAGWAAVAVDFASDGSAWVAVRDSSLMHVSNEGQILHSIRLNFSPSCVRVDRADDSVYVVGGALAKFSREGQMLFALPFDTSGFLLHGFSLALDQNGDVWVGTKFDVRKYSPDGTLLLDTSRFSYPSDTWISIFR